jgi:hypothetical protein
MRRPLRSNGLRGRRAIAWAGLFFLLAQIGGSVLLDYVWTAVKFRSLTNNVAAIETWKRSPDLICLGSSRMGAAFRQDVVQDRLRQATGDSTLFVFNASIEGANLITMDYAMEKLLAAGARPRWVLLEIEPENLARCNRWHRFDALRMMAWHNFLDFAIESRRSGGFREIMMTRLLPLYHFRTQILTETGRALGLDAGPPQPSTGAAAQPESAGVPWTVYMAQKRDESMPPEVRTKIGLETFERWLVDYEIGGKPVEALARLIQRCQQAGAEVLLVAVPTSSTHRRVYTPEIDARFLAHMRQAQDSFGCRFVDYRDRVPDRLFQDSHHVLLEGGKLFSQQIASEVLAPLLAGSRPMARQKALESD